jgi:hypothetical protein
VAESCAALHLWSQIVGKYRLARTPWVNHSWHATLYVTSRGLSTGAVHDGGQVFEILLDLIDHCLQVGRGDGAMETFPLRPMAVAEFHWQFVECLGRLSANATFSGKPNEIADALPFAEDGTVRSYDAAAVSRFLRALQSIDRVFRQSRTGFIGKVSPVHLFWGSFDLAVTRFSGRPAPPHPGGIPALPDAVTREAYSHQVSSAGFWPGGNGIDYPAFYSYAYPSPAGFAEAKVEPESAFFSAELGEFLLPYDAVRSADDPEGMLLAFLQSTYEVAASLGDWDRAALECAPGEPLRPRPLA